MLIALSSICIWIFWFRFSFDWLIFEATSGLRRKVPRALQGASKRIDGTLRLVVNFKKSFFWIFKFRSNLLRFCLNLMIWAFDLSIQSTSYPKECRSIDLPPGAEHISSIFFDWKIDALHEWLHNFQYLEQNNLINPNSLMLF